MRRLLSVIALCLALVLGASPSFAADADHGAQVFSANCAACHMGGGNVVNAERTLKKDALRPTWPTTALATKRPSSTR